MKRRNFIQQVVSSSVFLGIGGVSLNSCISNIKKQITILHTNDVHSHIDPFPSNHSHHPNAGGVARRAQLIEQIRKENPNTLLFDAGDIFQGTPYFNFYGGELEFKLMSLLQYDAATLGNHDFDNGIDGIYAQLPHAKFDLLSANYDFKNTILDTHIKPYKIFYKENIKIGVFGLGIKLKGLVIKELYKETKYNDPITIAQDISKKLKKEEQCDLVICLSHLGYTYRTEKVSDLKLAAQTEHIDLIIGGHTHTFLKKPTLVKNRKGIEVLVNQVGCYGLYLGKIDFYFEKETSSSKAISMVV